MANYNVSVTQSIEAQPANIAAGESTTYVISNPLPATSYFTLETARNANGFYDSTSPKNTSGSFTLGTGITSLIQSDYIAGVIVQPGGGNLTFVPAVNITNSTLYLRGVGSNEGVAFPPVPPPVPLLLDTYPALAAYSLRKLRTAYTGSAIRVRRSSDNNEQDIGFNGSNELDITALLSFVGAGNGFVVTWYDQSATGHNFTQSTASLQPQIVSSGSVITLNSLPSILMTAEQWWEKTLFTNKLLDIYIVRENSKTSYVKFTGTNLTGRGYDFIAQSGTTSTVIYQDYGTPNLYANKVLFTGTTRNDVYNFLNGTKLEVQQGGNIGTSGFDWTYFRFGFYASTMFAFAGKSSELIFFDNSSQSSNRNNIETNINNFYSIY